MDVRIITRMYERTSRTPTQVSVSLSRSHSCNSCSLQVFGSALPNVTIRMAVAQWGREMVCHLKRSNRSSKGVMALTEQRLGSQLDLFCVNASNQIRPRSRG